MDNISEVAVTIAGFSGLLVVLRPRDEKLSRLERYRIYFLLATSLSAVVLGLLPSVVRPYLAPEAAAVVLCAAGTLCLAGLGVWRLSMLRRLGPTSASRPRIVTVLALMNWTMAAVSALATFGVVPRTGMFGVILWWLVSVAICQFAVHIVSVLEHEEPG